MSKKKAEQDAETEWVVRESFKSGPWFVLQRDEDVTGTSGTGVVAEGVRFTGGKVALHWLSVYGAVNVYDSVDVVETLHGHDGRTRIVWVDE